MNTSRFAATLIATALLCGACHAAERPADRPAGEPAAADAAPVMMASTSFVDFDINALTAPLTRMRAASSGVVESLPDTPEVQNVGSPLPFYLFRLAPETSLPSHPAQQPESMTEPSFDDPGMMSMVMSSPISGIARKMRAERFNTDDGVMDDFAICYRLNDRSSIQVIPGDPAPVKLPLNAMAASAGVTVGMAMRLGKQR